MQSNGEQTGSREPRQEGTPPHSAELPAEDPVLEADMESFPASDAPSWTPLHTGSPKGRE